MFEQLKQLLAGSEAGLAEVLKLESNYNTLSGEVSKLEAKLNDAVSKRDKYKGFTKAVKTKLGIDENEELTEETVNEKLNVILSKKDVDLTEKERVLKLEIQKMEEAVKNKDIELKTSISSVEKEIFETKLELELYKSATTISAVNDVAYKIIVDELKKGASIEEGKILFKNEDGTTARINGVQMTLADKVNSIKADEKLGFLFKADIQSGSGVNTFKGSNKQNGISDFAQQKIEKAKQLGINLN